MAHKLKVQVDLERNTASISMVDKSGNGLIILSGKMGGCDFLSPAEQLPRFVVLQQLNGQEVGQ